jgi:two-component sensor histidine kinase
VSDAVRILYIDDDLGLGRLIEKSLGQSGVAVCHVETGDEAISLLSKEDFDIVALDHNLVSETGLEILPRIRALPSAPPVIYVTGSDDVRIAMAALQAGAVDYVWKDVDGHYRELLGRAIDSALAREREIRERIEALRLMEEARDRAQLLLSEVNHRVANSLSLVASMVQMQTRAAPDEAQHALKETQARIAAVASIHRHLYTSSDVRIVDLDTYLASLTCELAIAMQADNVVHEISFGTDGKVQVPTNMAVSLGILVTELVTNAYKYAYATDVRGQIRVRLKQPGDGCIALTVEDDGVGWNGNGTPKGSGLGTRIIKATTGQLHATLSYDAQHKGTRVVLDMPVPESGAAEDPIVRR